MHTNGLGLSDRDKSAVIDASPKRVWLSHFVEPLTSETNNLMSAPTSTSEAALATDSDLTAIVADYANSAELPPAD